MIKAVSECSKDFLHFLLNHKFLNLSYFSFTWKSTKTGQDKVKNSFEFLIRATHFSGREGL